MQHDSPPPHPAAAEPAGAAPQPAEPPRHDAHALTAGGRQASIVLDDKVYSLRITRAGKLILTK